MAALDANDWALALAKQTHSDIRIHIASPFRERPAEGRVRALSPTLSLNGEGDALLTNVPGILVGVKTADCVPVLIVDPKTKTVAAVHAGWRGTLQRITEKTVADMKTKFGVNPKDCLAAIGPSACGDCYEIGAEVTEQFEEEFRDAGKFLKNFSVSGKAFMDGRAANLQQLLLSGLKHANVAVSDRCTMHENDIFFSHRREGASGANVGRMLSVIGVPRDR